MISPPASRPGTRGNSWASIAFQIGFKVGATQIDRLSRLIQRQVDAFCRQRIDKFGQQTRRNRDRAFFFDFGVDPAVDANFQIIGGQQQAVVVGSQQHIRQHRQGASVGHGSPNDAQSFGQILLQTRDFHLGTSLLSRKHGYQSWKSQVQYHP